MVAISLTAVASIAAIFAQTALAAPSPTIGFEGVYDKRAVSCTFPTPPKTSSLSAPITVTGTFDGKSASIDQTEGGDADAVFLLQAGATLQNVVIGANQAEGVHCLGPCNLYNVWFEDVCEDAITLKQTSGQSNIVGGGAKGASDKVVQHNGGGTVKISSYCVSTFGKLYRSCSNCSTQYKRAVYISNSTAINGSVLAGLNSIDVAYIDTSSMTLINVTSICSPTTNCIVT